MMNYENKIFSAQFLKQQLLTEHEVEIFNQLQKDRHRCAHPAFITNEALFRPTAELVRFYLVHALTSLLIHAPLQGKHVIEKFKSDVTSDYFPPQPSKAAIFIRERFLKNAKDSLIVSLIQTILSLPFASFESISSKNTNRFAIVLSVLSNEKRSIFERESRSYIARKYSNITGHNLLYIYLFSSRIPEIWDWVSLDTKEAAKQVVKSIEFPKISAFRVFSCIKIEELKEHLLAEFEKLDYKNQIKVVEKFPSPHFASFVISKFEIVPSFRSAELVASDLIIPMIKHFSHSDINALFDAFKTNDQINCAHGIPEIFKALLNERPDFDVKRIYNKLSTKAEQQSLNGGEMKLLSFLDEYLTAKSNL